MRRNLWIGFILLVLSACGDNTNVYVGNELTGNPQPQQPPAEPIKPPAPSKPPRDPSLGFEGEVTTEFQQLKRSDKVDILFSVDHSGSMDPHIEKVMRNISLFIEGLLREKVDFQIGFLMSSETADGSSRPGLIGPHPVVKSGDSGVSEKVGENLKAILDENVGGVELGVSILDDAIDFPINRILFREDSAKAFVVLTDASDNRHEESAIPYFVKRFTDFAAPQAWTMIGIGLPEGAPDCDLESTDHRLLEGLTRASGGLMGSICDADFSDILLKAADAVVHLRDEFSLGQFRELKNATILEIEVKVDGVMINADPVNGYVWNLERLSISFRGRSIPAEGKKVSVRIKYRMEK